jgi:hypothetical protein
VRLLDHLSVGGDQIVGGKRRSRGVLLANAGRDVVDPLQQRDPSHAWFAQDVAPEPHEPAAVITQDPIAGNAGIDDGKM